MNMGQLAELMTLYILLDLGILPELRHKQKRYGKIAKPLAMKLANYTDYWWVFALGKTYTAAPGVHGGGKRKVVELDFAQMYPTHIANRYIDPLVTYVAERLTLTADGGIRRQLNFVTEPDDNTAWVVLSNNDAIEAAKVYHAYGPVAFLSYKLYTFRNRTKALRKQRPEFKFVDQAVKILANSFYGAMGKRRGNLVNEYAAASVFWETQRILYEVIDYVNGLLGNKGYVAYGDTDSTFIVVDSDVDPEEIERRVNTWLTKRYGALYKMELEGVYDKIVVAKKLDKEEAAAKTYLVVSGGKIVKAKGEFYKLPYPLVVKEKLHEFLEELLQRARSVDDVRSILREWLERAELYKVFVRGSVSSFFNDDDELKNLNRDSHYAAVIRLCESQTEGTVIKSRKRSSRDAIEVDCVVYPGTVEEVQGAVVFSYLPSRTGSGAPLIYLEDDGVTVTALQVQLLSLRRGTETYHVKYRKTYVKLDRQVLVHEALNRLEHRVVVPLAKKLGVNNRSVKITEWLQEDVRP